MAFSLNNGQGGGRRGYRGGSAALAEINIVPLVDVVLVLLIIFMLTAHVMEFGMEVNVPKTKNTPKDTAEILPVINVARDGTLYLIDKEVNYNNLGTAIRAKFGKAKAVYLRGDKEVTWDVIAQVVSALNQAKLDIRIVTQPVENLGPHKQ